MTTEDQRISGDDCVPFFKSDKSQIKFEFWFLVSCFVLASASVALIRFALLNGIVDRQSATFLYAAAGGFHGGLAFDIKWFYRVTARGREDQHPHKWQRHKFYWRVMIPFVAGAISFAVYSLVATGAFPIVIKNPTSGKTAFGLSFFLGYFSDLVLSRLAKWTEKMVPRGGS